MLWHLWRVVRFILLLPIRLFVLGCATAIIRETGQELAVFHSIPQWWLVIPGMLAGLLVAAATYGKAETIYVWIHELTHLLAGLPFLILPAGIRVRQDEGGAYRGAAVGILWPLGIDFCLLAPYFLPLLALPFVALYPLWGATLSPILLSAIGLGIGVQLVAGPREVVEQWTSEGFRDVFGGKGHTDIARTGFFASIVFIPLYAVLVAGIMATVINRGYAGVPEFLLDIYRNADLHSWEIIEKLPFRLPKV